MMIRRTMLLKNSSGVKPLLLISLTWCWMIFFINPVGEFPLNDSWVYTLSVQELLKSGRFMLTGGANINLLTHVLWGSGFCALFGQSFMVLRSSTLVMGLISRTLPQLNILAVGFGMNSMLTFGTLGIVMGSTLLVFQEQVEPAFESILRVLHAPLQSGWLT